MNRDAIYVGDKTTSHPDAQSARPGSRLGYKLAFGLVLAAGALGYRAIESVGDGHRGEALVEGVAALALGALAHAAGCKSGHDGPFVRPC